MASQSEFEVLIPVHQNNTQMLGRKKNTEVQKRAFIKCRFVLVSFLLFCVFILTIYAAKTTRYLNSSSSTLDKVGLGAEAKPVVTPVVPPVKSNVATDSIKTKPKPSFPDIDYAFLGYNIMNGYPLANGHDPGFTNPIFKADYSTQRETGDRRFSVPTGYNIIPDVSCQTSFVSEVIKTRKDLKESMESTAKVHGGGWGFSFRASSDYQKSYESMESEQKVLVISKANCQYYYAKIDELNPPPFSDSFVEWLQRLNNSNSREDLLDFMSYYGTHFLKVVDFGARYQFVHSMTQSNYEELKKQSISVEAQASFSCWFFTAGASASLTKDQQSAVAQFNQMVETKIITVGSVPPSNGDPNMWASTVQNTPVPFRYELVAIEELFTPVYMDKYPGINQTGIKSALEFIHLWGSQELLERTMLEQMQSGCRVFNATFKLPTKTCIYQGSYSQDLNVKTNCNTDCTNNPACLASTYFQKDGQYNCFFFNTSEVNVVDNPGIEEMNCASIVFPGKLQLKPSSLGNGQLAGKILITNLTVKSSSDQHTVETCQQHTQTCEDSCLLDSKCVMFYQRKDPQNQGVYCCGLVDQSDVTKLVVERSSDANEYVAFIKTDC